MPNSQKISDNDIEKYLKEHLTIHVSKQYRVFDEGNEKSIVVELKLDDEVISSDCSY